MLAGCQCFVPVDEGRDAGRDASDDAGVDAGVDAGTDAGADAGFDCDVASDCTGTPRVTRWCEVFGGPDAGFSCVAHRCVAECGDVAGETCDIGDGACLICPRGASCIPVDCFPGGGGFSFGVEDIACRDTPPLEVGARVVEFPTNPDGGVSCSRTLFLEDVDGGRTVLGTLYLQTARGLTVEAPLLGGTCLAYELPTGAYRLLLDCPRCQVALGP